MRHPSSPRVTITSALAGLSAAQELPSNLAGCGEVRCPNADEGESIENVCVLQNRTFGDVGVSDFGWDALGAEAEAADILTWVRGNNLTTRDGGEGAEAVVRSSFYLGTPFEYDAGDVRACAAFFHRANATFGGDDVGTASGSCLEAGVSRACVDALVARAEALEVGEGDDACAMLQDDLRENLDRACAGVAGGDRWRDVNVRPILGPGAPDEIISSDNLTSNCWPITPKEHDLTFIESYEQTTDDLTEDGTNALFYGVTPILTVFYDWGANASSPETSFTMSCMKVMNSSVAAIERLYDDDYNDDDDDDDDDNDDNNGEGAATIARVSGTAATIAVVVVAFGHLLL